VERPGRGREGGSTWNVRDPPPACRTTRPARAVCGTQMNHPREPRAMRPPRLRLTGRTRARRGGLLQTDRWRRRPAPRMRRVALPRERRSLPRMLERRRGTQPAIGAGAPAWIPGQQREREAAGDRPPRVTGKGASDGPPEPSRRADDPLLGRHRAGQEPRQAGRDIAWAGEAESGGQDRLVGAGRRHLPGADLDGRTSAARRPSPIRPDRPRTLETGGHVTGPQRVDVAGGRGGRDRWGTGRMPPSASRRRGVAAAAERGAPRWDS
jgi:hypothetical protein